MKHNDFYDVIFKRKSVRKYDLTPVDEKTIEDISTYMNTVKPMYENIKIEMKIVTQESVKSLLPIKAPYYILVSSENKEGYLTNAGFMIQQVDLFLSANGIGSCWVGMAQPKKGIVNESELEYVIALAFGNPAETLHRKDISQFKRKSIEEIRDTNGKDQLIELARLAPSATNSQPWFFSIDNYKINVYCVKSNFIKAIMYKKMNQIDMGIAICHLWVAARHFEKDLKYTFDKEEEEKSPSGYYYITSLIINE
ncbi:nitroreductase family protein [Tepidibacter mesophilus]|uniref:nitroreductase family protein n=1 Tax=Tepidibacter mesophilus TaxID=655607 RepID=UPI000C088E5F|nr:nitroreductase family protein [Tepidibacter mesophilus]